MASRGLGFVKRLWHEKPDIAGSLCLCVVGIAAGVRYVMIYDRDTFHKHRWEYTVIRDNEADPNFVKKGVYN